MANNEDVNQSKPTNTKFVLILWLASADNYFNIYFKLIAKEMDLQLKYNQRNPAVKRIMREACELKSPTDEYFARPLEDNLFEWHFTVHGSPETEYSDGVYHGRILLPPEYPMKPPNIILLTPNGRFEVNKKICLSISGHHPETWQPSWSIRTALLALIAFMSSPGKGSIGALDYTPDERKILARKSQTWECDECGPINLLLNAEASQPATKDEEELLKCIDLKAEENTEKSGPTDESLNATEPVNVQGPPPPLSNQPEIRIPLNYVPNGLGRFGDIMIVLFVAAIAFLIARRMALSMFL